MESIGAFDAKSRLSELLDRVAHGESFEITKHGKPVGRLVPTTDGRDNQVVAEAVQRLVAFRGALKGMTASDIQSMKHEGHRH